MQAVDESGRFRMGLYKEPIALPAFDAAAVSDWPAWYGRPGAGGLGRWWRKARTKRWHFVSISHADWFLGLAVVQLTYLGNAFAYLVNRRTGEMAEFTTMSPLGRGIRMAPSSIDGVTEFRHGLQSIVLRWLPQTRQWRVQLRLPLRPAGARRGRWLQADVLMDAQAEAVALLYPLHANRAAYTHKEAGNPCRGTLVYGGQEIDLGEGRTTGGMDWTLSLANRRTEWNWLCLSGPGVGVNLSSRVYDDQENAAWVDGRVHMLGPATFNVPSNVLEPWTITASGLAVSVKPVGLRRENVQAGLIAASFVQACGEICGTLEVEGRRISLDGLFGVCEDHFAKW